MIRFFILLKLIIQCCGPILDIKKELISMPAGKRPIAQKRIAFDLRFQGIESADKGKCQ